MPAGWSGLHATTRFAWLHGFHQSWLNLFVQFHEFLRTAFHFGELSFRSRISCMASSDSAEVHTGDYINFVLNFLRFFLFFFQRENATFWICDFNIIFSSLDSAPINLPATHLCLWSICICSNNLHSRCINCIIDTICCFTRFGRNRDWLQLLLYIGVIIFVKKQKLPTITEKGYTLHTCSTCGYSYKDNYTNVKKQLQSITISTKPSKTTYSVNDAIDTSGMKIVATYTDGSKTEVSGWKINGSTIKAGKYNVKVTYSEGGIIPFKKNSEKSEKFPDNLQM